MFLTILLMACVAIPALAASPTSRIIRKRERNHAGWIQQSVTPEQHLEVSVAFALTQQNLDKGHDIVMDVSDPKSPNFGKHWTAEKVDLSLHLIQ